MPITDITEQHNVVTDSVNSLSIESEKIYNMSKVDQEPSFMGGGLEKMNKYFRKNMIYSEKLSL